MRLQQGLIAVDPLGEVTALPQIPYLDYLFQGGLLLTGGEGREKRGWKGKGGVGREGYFFFPASSPATESKKLVSISACCEARLSGKKQIKH